MIMIKSEKTTSVAMGRKPASGGPKIPPMPAVGHPARTVPSPISTFTNEANVRPTRMGNMSVNPGKK